VKDAEVRALNSDRVLGLAVCFGRMRP